MGLAQNSPGRGAVALRNYAFILIISKSTVPVTGRISSIINSSPIKSQNKRLSETKTTKIRRNKLTKKRRGKKRGKWKERGKANWSGCALKLRVKVEKAFRNGGDRDDH